MVPMLKFAIKGFRHTSFLQRKLVLCIMANRDMSKWKSFVSAFEIKDSIHYYQEKPGIHDRSPHLHDDIVESLASLTIYGITSVSADKPPNRVQNSLDNKQIQDRLSALENVHVKPSFLYWPTDPDRPIDKHVQVWVKEEPSFENEIRKICQDVGHSIYIKYSVKEKRLRQQIKDTSNGEVQSEDVIISVAAPTYHPALINVQSCALFRSTDEAVQILEQLGSSQSKDLLEIYHNAVARHQTDKNPRSLFIVIEGLDGVGKTTLTSAVATELNAKLLKTPPECASHLRPYFDSFPGVIRRAFYTIGNAIVSAMISDYQENDTLIMDRFWHSTAAYTIATECAYGDESVLPPRGHWCYQWPPDLVQPQVVVLLNVSEEVRDFRLHQRPGVITREEAELKRNVIFRRRLLEAYRRMSPPTPTKVDASPSKEEVLTATLEIIKPFRKNELLT